VDGSAPFFTEEDIRAAFKVKEERPRPRRILTLAWTSVRASSCSRSSTKHMSLRRECFMGRKLRAFHTLMGYSLAAVVTLRVGHCTEGQPSWLAGRSDVK
jgi:hypothetical protein